MDPASNSIHLHNNIVQSSLSLKSSQQTKTNNLTKSITQLSIKALTVNTSSNPSSPTYVNSAKISLIGTERVSRYVVGRLISVNSNSSSPSSSSSNSPLISPTNVESLQSAKDQLAKMSTASSPTKSLKNWLAKATSIYKATSSSPVVSPKDASAIKINYIVGKVIYVPKSPISEKELELSRLFESLNNVSGKSVTATILFQQSSENKISFKSKDPDVPIDMSSQFPTDLPRAVYTLNKNVLYSNQAPPEDEHGLNRVIYSTAESYLNAFKSQNRESFMGLSCLVNQATFADLSVKVRHIESFRDLQNINFSESEWALFSNMVLPSNLNTQFQVNIEGFQVTINLVSDFKLTAASDIMHKDKVYESGDTIGFCSVKRIIKISSEELAKDWSQMQPDFP